MVVGEYQGRNRPNDVKLVLVWGWLGMVALSFLVWL